MTARLAVTLECSGPRATFVAVISAIVFTGPLPLARVPRDPPEMPVRLTHVVLKVRDLDRSVAFYRRFCALEIVRDGRPKGHTVWLAPALREAGLPAFVLVLYLTEVDCRIDHLGFQCAERAEVDRIAAEGELLGILAQPAVDGGGDIGYVTMIRDPDGHLVEFTHGQPLRGL